jgi:hypothetical protein
MLRCVVYQPGCPKAGASGGGGLQRAVVRSTTMSTWKVGHTNREALFRPPRHVVATRHGGRLWKPRCQRLQGRRRDQMPRLGQRWCSPATYGPIRTHLDCPSSGVMLLHLCNSPAADRGARRQHITACRFGQGEHSDVECGCAAARHCIGMLRCKSRRAAKAVAVPFARPNAARNGLSPSFILLLIKFCLHQDQDDRSYAHSP